MLNLLQVEQCLDQECARAQCNGGVLCLAAGGHRSAVASEARGSGILFGLLDDGFPIATIDDVWTALVISMQQDADFTLEALIQYAVDFGFAE